jgi:hypothetical protein
MSSVLRTSDGGCLVWVAGWWSVCTIVGEDRYVTCRDTLYVIALCTVVCVRRHTPAVLVYMYDQSIDI